MKNQNHNKQSKQRNNMKKQTVSNSEAASAKPTAEQKFVVAPTKLATAQKPAAEPAKIVPVQKFMTEPTKTGNTTKITKEKGLIISTALFTLYIFVFLLTEFTVNVRCDELLGSENVVAIYSIGIICTSLGYLSFFLTRRKVSDENKRRIILVMLAVIFMASTIGFIKTTTSLCFIILALLALLTFGYIGGFAHYTVSLFLFNSNHSGKVIGFSIAIATMIQFTVQNLPIREQILEASIAASLIGIIYLALKPVKDWMFENPLPYASEPTITIKQLWIPMAAISLMSLCFGLGDGLVTWLHASGTVDLSSFPRLMYAMGIVIAGIIADVKRRKYLPLATICMLVLSSSMALFLEEGNTGSSTLYVAVMYLFAGFYVMYMTHTFIAIAPMTEYVALWTGMGRILRGPFIAITAMLSAPLFESLGPNGIAVAGILLSILTLILLVSSGSLAVQPALQDRKEKTTMEDFVAECRLTPRETEIIALLLDSNTTNKDIASELYISQRVLERYITSIYEKIGVQSRIQLVNRYYKTNQADTEAKAKTKPKRQPTQENSRHALSLAEFSKKYSLTTRETELLELVGRKLTNEKMAAELGISENTVKFHLKNLMKKTATKNRAELREMLEKK